MQPYILGIDIGTGSTKAVAVTYTGEVIHVAQEHYPTLHPQPFYSEQEPEVIWEAFKKCCAAVVITLSQQPEAVCFSSAMHSLTCVNQKGQPIYNLITWADTRSADIAERIKHSVHGNSIYKNTGTPVHSMSPLCKIIWIKENNTELFNNTHKFISIKEYIWFKLFNEFTIDYSVASATGLFNIHTLQWHEEALAAAGIQANHLSAPADTDYQKKGLEQTIAAELNLSSEVPFIIGASDGCMANVGSFAFNKEQAALTIGSSGAVRLLNNKPISNYQSMPFSYYLSKNNFVCGGAINNGGTTIKWLLKHFLQISSPEDKHYNDLFATIQQVPDGSDGLLFIPYLTGERAPVWDAKSSGLFLGISNRHAQPHFLKAVVEGICYALYDVLHAVELLCGNIKQLTISGGFTNSDVWMQLLANITGKKLYLIQTEDASAIGAALFALKSLNHIKDFKEVMPPPEKVIEPDFDAHQKYLDYFHIFQTVYPNLKNTMHSLYSIKQ